MAEQRAFDQLARNRRKVHGHERRVRHACAPVDEPRQEFFAGAALSQDQHRSRQLRHPLHQLDDVSCPPARTDDELTVDPFGHFRTKPNHVTVEILTLAGLGHDRADCLVVEVLGDVVIGAIAHGFDGGVEVSHGGRDDHFDRGVVLSSDLQHFESADAGQAHVEEYQLDVLLLHDLQRGFAGGDSEHAVVAFEDGAQVVTHALVVIDDQHGFRTVGHARCEYSALLDTAKFRWIR